MPLLSGYLFQQNAIKVKVLAVQNKMKKRMWLQYQKLIRISKYNLFTSQIRNKMAKVLKITNHKYPFGQNLGESEVRVQETQFFSMVERLLEKKSEMNRKQEMVNNAGIIQLFRLQVQGSLLVYEWEYIPFSISSYLRYKFDSSSHAIWENAKSNIIKRITFQLTALMSYLAKMRIQTELSTQTLGISHDEKLKLYLNPKCTMGIRSQLSLISQYGKAKERILKQIRAELELFNINPDNLNFKVTRPYFEGKMTNKSLFESINSNSDLKRQHRGSIDHEQPQTPFRRKMSFGNFQFNKAEKPQREKLRQSQTPRHHKYSFQFNQNGKEQSLNGSFFQNEREVPINHSKSIKIQLQQTSQNINSKRKRKDSYKVKITTTREYQVDDPTIFNQNNKDEEQMFQYFSRQHQTSKQPKSYRPQQQKEGLNTTAAHSPPPSPLLSAKQSPKSPSICLQQRIRQARQRSQRVLAKMKHFKK